MNISYTGYVTFYLQGPDGSTNWILGRNFLSDPSYTANNFVTNLVSQTQMPPNTVQSYTINSNNTWAYNPNNMLWYEISKQDYIALQNKAAPITVVYQTTTTPSSVLLNNTTIDNTKTSVAPGFSIDIFWPNSQQSTIQSTNIPWLLTEFTNLIAYSVAPSITTGIIIWNKQSASWAIIHQDQIVEEPFIDIAGILYWRPNTAYNIYSELFSHPINYTGMVALFVTQVNGTQGWRVARNSLDGSGLDYTINFSNTFLNTITQPPNSFDSYTLRTNYKWAYHIQHMIWYEVTTDTYTKISLAMRFANISYSTTKLIPMLFTNNTSLYDPNITCINGNFEAVWERIPGMRHPPDISTVPYFNQTTGTFTNGAASPTNPNAIQNIFGAADSTLSAFSAIPKPSDGIIVGFNHGSNYVWQALYNNQVIVQGVADITGKITYSTTFLKLFVVQARIWAINQNLTVINGIITKMQQQVAAAQISTNTINAIWETSTSLSSTQITQVQNAGVAASTDTSRIASLINTLQSTITSNISFGDLYKNAQNNEDIVTLKSIYDQSITILQTAQNSQKAADTCMDNIKNQVDATTPSNLQAAIENNFFTNPWGVIQTKYNNMVTYVTIKALQIYINATMYINAGIAWVRSKLNF